MGRGRKASIERERVRPRNNEEKKGGEGDKEGGRERRRERETGRNGGRGKVRKG